ncbi:EamA family transporter [Azospirillum endophyticum]
MDKVTQSTRKRLLGYGLIAASSLLFGLTGTLAKMLFVADLPPLVMVALRTFISAAVMAAVIPALGKPIRVRQADLPFLVCLGVLLTLVNVTFFYAITLTNVAIALMLEYTAPIIIVLSGMIMGSHRLTRPVLLILAGNTIGCFLLVGGYDKALWTGNAIGVMVGLLCAISFAVYNIYCARGHSKGLDSWNMNAWPFLFSSVFWLLATPFVDYGATEWSWEVIGFTFFIGILGTVLPYWLYLEGLRYIDPFPATIVGMLDPIFAALTAYMLLGELLELPQAGGMLLICAMIALLEKADGAAGGEPPTQEPSLPRS